MAPRITLITGCSSGIGLSTAVALAQDPAKGYIVYASMRNLAKKDALAKAAGAALNKTLFIVQLDVTKEDSVKKAVGDITKKHGRIEILVNNAGYGSGGFIELQSMETIRNVFETNFFGVVRLTQEVIPFMKKQRSGRIISISSVAGITAWPFGEIYAGSKFALEGFTESLAIGVRPFNIWVSSVQPGPVRTAFIDNMGEANKQTPLANLGEVDIDPESKEIFGKAMGLLIGTGSNLEKEYQTPEEISDVIKGALEAKAPHLRYATSQLRLDYAKQFFVDPTGDKFINTIIPHINPDAPQKK